MNLQSKILVIAKQAGTASAFVPLIRELANRFTVRVLATEHAGRVFSEAKVDFKRFMNFEDSGVLRGVTQSDLLLTGTSAEAADDSKFWAWAHRHGIPSIGFVDQWVNLEHRFLSGASSDQNPMIVAVIDENDAFAAEKLHLAGSRVHITGSPALDDIAEQVTKLRLGLPEVNSRPIAVFATEPSSVETDTQYRANNGFNDLDALQLTVENLATIPSLADWILKIKLHPRDRRERIEKFLKTIEAPVKFEIIDSGRAEMIACADVVIGTRSFFLLESAICGVPVISLQPGRKTSCPLTDGKSAIHVVTDRTDATLAFRSLQILSKKSLVLTRRERRSIESFIGLIESEITHNQTRTRK
jgi:hypothetical protein